VLASALVIADTISWGRFVLAVAAAGGTILLLTLIPLRRQENGPLV
jgi:hypothetical protein